eukprot:CAMPEP_0204619752 /NCGR_PEP_ID=MMETSP0717-20131115/6019_1 /ASSEMBLY_ACC=CAM_ASM_000666 /TAXON_ID=230516 /ORGANISM="Chaetoceros curvisetus" /LENGTH=176 /DNA_ID=CAMNT_0051633809 /DNA_START=78 /DNA_END=605 /DNA_ORIENTATION=+
MIGFADLFSMDAMLLSESHHHRLILCIIVSFMEYHDITVRFVSNPIHFTTLQCIKEVPLKSLHGRKIAIDASMAIYQFLIAVRHGNPNNPAAMLTNAEGETTSHIQGLFNRTIRFMTEGVRPVYVFDGKPPNIKSGELVKRREKREEAQKKLAEAKEEGNMEEQTKQSKRLVRAGQ